MKKISKFLFLILILSFSMLSVIFFSACSESLSAPSDLRITGTVFSWSIVDDAAGYYVQINNNEPISVGNRTSYNIASYSGQINTLSVKASAGETDFRDSDWASLTVYTVSYVLNGGTNHANNPIFYTPNSDVINLSNPTRLGFAFTGWAEGTTIPMGSTGNKTFTATWSIITNTITYVLNGGINHYSNPQGFNIETPTITLENPSKDGYAFVRWEEGNTILLGSVGDRTFTATWTMQGTEGLLYTFINESMSYSVSRGTATASEVTIQAYYNGLPVTQIGMAGFSGFTQLTSIVLPNTLTTIRGGAFQNCVNLEGIIIPDSVTTILGNFIFANTTSLESITLPNSLTAIPNAMFDNTGLTSIVIPNSVTTIMTGAFRGASNLANIVLPNSLITIEGGAFAGTTSLTNITLPNSLITIGAGAFNNTGLVSLVIPDSVTALQGSNIFANNAYLTSVIIGNSVPVIPPSAFIWATSLIKVVIPASVRRIESGAFSHNTSLTDIYFRGTSTQWNSIIFGGIGGPYVFPEDITIHLNWVG